MKLFYKAGACALNPHIVLAEQDIASTLMSKIGTLDRYRTIEWLNSHDEKCRRSDLINLRFNDVGHLSQIRFFKFMLGVGDGRHPGIRKPVLCEKSLFSCDHAVMIA